MPRAAESYSIEVEHNDNDLNHTHFRAPPPLSQVSELENKCKERYQAQAKNDSYNMRELKGPVQKHCPGSFLPAFFFFFYI